MVAMLSSSFASMISEITSSSRSLLKRIDVSQQCLYTVVIVSFTINGFTWAAKEPTMVSSNVPRIIPL